jgi:hypothetical protein
MTTGKGVGVDGYTQHSYTADGGVVTTDGEVGQGLCRNINCSDMTIEGGRVV